MKSIRKLVVIMVSIMAALSIVAIRLTASDNRLDRSKDIPFKSTNRYRDISPNEVNDVIFPNLIDTELMSTFNVLTGQRQREEISLLGVIKREAAVMDVFPLDLIIDYRQISSKSVSETAPKVTKFIKRRVIVESKNDRRFFFPTSFLCVDDISQEYDTITIEAPAGFIENNVEKRYDLTYERFVPFYRFYHAALNATKSEIDECTSSFHDLTPKEKALALSAIYIFEQTRRIPINSKVRKYCNETLKYDNSQSRLNIDESIWNNWLSLLKDNANSRDVSFEKISNEGLVEEWERSLRINALLFQSRLAHFNPYFQPQLNEYWYSLCRLAPVDFLYALLLSETDDEFLKSNKTYPRISVDRTVKLYKDSNPTSFEFRILQYVADNKPIDDELFHRLGIRCDASNFYLTKMTYDDYLSYKKNNGANNNDSINEAVCIMREYLKTQYSFSRNKVVVYKPYDTNKISKDNKEVRHSGFDYNWDPDMTLLTIDVNRRQAKYGNDERFPFDINSSYEDMKLGFVASSLLRARDLFDEEE